MDVLTFVLGGGGLLAVASFLLSLNAARRDVMKDQLLQWRVEVADRTPVSVTVFVAPIGGEVRDVRLLLGVPPQTFDPDSRVQLAEWPPRTGMRIPTHLLQQDHDRLFVHITFRSVEQPSRTHETWIPVLKDGSLSDLHLRQVAAPALIKWWRWMTQAPVGPEARGLAYRRFGEGGRNRRLRRAMKAS